MKLLMSVLFVGLALVAARPEVPSRDVHGAQLFRVNVNNTNALRQLAWLQVNSYLDFWTEPRQLGKVDIMARRWDIPQLKQFLRRLDLQHEILISDMGKFSAERRIANDLARSRSTKMDWVSYHTYDEIDAWLDEIVAANPDVASVIDAGETFEGRTMRVLKLSTGPGKEAIFTDGGIHAREWISPATVTFMINELITSGQQYLEGVDFYFMPVINPDGYSFTFTDDRFWRKTRSTDASALCVGADPNRNWDYHWMEGGASDNPCSDIFAGPVPFSEVEMRNVRDQILAIQPRVYLTFHSYSQLWMYPWGWTSDLPENWQDLDALAQDAVAALTAVYGTGYGIGSSTNTIYIAAGGSDDWALGAGGSEYAYTVELRDEGNYGFDLPTEQIIPSGEETYEALKVVAQFVIDNPAIKK